LAPLGGLFMNEAVTGGIALAPGFEFSDHLASPYRLAYRHIRRSCATISITQVDGSAQGELPLPPKEHPLRRSLCFSPDGSVLYRHDERLYVHDLAAHTVRALPAIPQEPLFDWVQLCEVSPDNRFLLCTQTAMPRFVRGRSGPATSFRLCRVDANGDGFRILYEDLPDYYLFQIACCWQREFALLLCHGQSPATRRGELYRLDLNTGSLESIGYPPQWVGTLIVYPTGERVALSTCDGKIWLGALSELGIRQARIIAGGTAPTWSPDGASLAFMNDQHCLAIWDFQTEQSRELVWFEPPYLTEAQRGGMSCAVTPVWSPDGRMLWFALTQTVPLRFPRRLSGIAALAYRRIYPFFHNLNPRRTSYYAAYRHQAHRHCTGIVDLHTKRVRITEGFEYGVTWIQPFDVAPTEGPEVENPR
jgi:hypothetical protein